MEQEQAEEIVQDFWLTKLIIPTADQTIAAKYLEKVRETPSLPGHHTKKEKRSGQHRCYGRF